MTFPKLWFSLVPCTSNPLAPGLLDPGHYLQEMWCTSPYRTILHLQTFSKDVSDPGTVVGIKGVQSGPGRAQSSCPSSGACPLILSVQVRGEQIKMTMEYDAFDDQYKGCENEMDLEASRLLEHEMRENELLQLSWVEAREKWQNGTKEKVSPLPSGFKDEYGIAVVMYTNDKIHLDFNRAVRTNGTSLKNYKSNFQYKAVHFYLTRALQLLPKVKYTMQLFRGSKEEFTHRGMGPMRLGRFGSTSQNRSVSEEFGTCTFYTIYTCLGVDIQKFSFDEGQREVLIPVNEVFTITPGNERGHFILNSKKTLACFNCAYRGSELVCNILGLVLEGNSLG
ncbi:ecto-ADP-ribosyltransferase 5-like [Tachyglossus aculeatus]|uniref:ecto-ADP-ribosyltransferase 5-like n=1 Tax=Tachyglossus aculeatus TaxID=9261 RepID=UPI0018F3A11B|nr:ecto-ADP-ribosyltransferase 5-like [Tachyglossus aculeatus]